MRTIHEGESLDVPLRTETPSGASPDWVAAGVALALVAHRRGGDAPVSAAITATASASVASGLFAAGALTEGDWTIEATMTDGPRVTKQRDRVRVGKAP
jgi:hypothetical protein